MTRRRDLHLLVAGTFLLMLGNGVRFVVGSWIALEVTGNPAAPVAVLVAEAAPALLFATQLGAVVDRFDRRHVAAAADVVRALLAAAAALVAATGGLALAHLVVMAAVLGACDQLSTPARTALVRGSATDDGLLGASTRMSLATQLGTMAGVVLGGVAVGALPVTTVFAGLAAIHAVAAVQPMLVGRPPPRDAADEQAAGSAWAYLRGARELAAPFLAVLYLAALIKVYNAVLPTFAKDASGFTSAQFGAVDAAFAVGGIVAGGVLLRWHRRPELQRRAHLGLLLLAAATTAFASSPGFVVAAALYGLVGAAFQTLTLYMVRCQQLVPLDRYGRVFTGMARIGTLLVLALYGVVAVALQVAGPVVVYVLLAASLCGLAVHQARALPAPVPPPVPRST